MHDDVPSPDEALENFQGVARLFPLPNLVMFPHIVQPLHIFEQRYRDMVREALATDRLIAMVLLKPGWGKRLRRQPAGLSHGLPWPDPGR